MSNLSPQGHTDLRQVRLNRRAALIAKGREDQRTAEDWARSQGFSNRWAPLAASVAGRLKAQKKREITRAEVTAELEREWGYSEEAS